MSVGDCLRKARLLISTGWTEPLSVDERGAAGVTFKTAEQTCVNDALYWCAASFEEYLKASELLEAVATPNWAAWLDATDLNRMTPARWAAAQLFAQRVVANGEGGGLQFWLQKEGRTHDQVLALFNRALVRTLLEN